MIRPCQAFRLACLALCASACLPAADAAFPRQWFLNAHNSYPAGDRGWERLARARRAGLWAVELDLVWSQARGHTVINHETKLRGNEPTLEDYFFTPLLPELRSLPRDEPGLLLMIDLKSDHPGPARELHDLLRQHRDLMTRSLRSGDLRWGPLTVILSENAAAIALFEKLTPPEEPYLAMAVREPPERKFQENIAAYIPQRATPFYRLFNFDWKIIERVANPEAGAFTRPERARLEALVKLAREKGYWIRTWTLNATSTMWGTGRNFGSRHALLTRWRAALAAGVDCIATDEYELAGRFMANEAARPPTTRSTDSPRPPR